VNLLEEGQSLSSGVCLEYRRYVVTPDVTPVVIATTVAIGNRREKNSK